MHRTSTIRTFVSVAAGSAALALLTAAGCTKSEPTATGKAETTGKASTSGTVTTAAWVLTDTPAGEPLSVAEAKTAAAEGDTVTIRGRIGGRAHPITADSPVFLVMDLAVPSCAEEEGDQCSTPWDYCCETPETITANSATVQIVAPDGSTIEADPIAGGLHALDEVIVVGTVGPRPSPGVLTIRATGVHRVGG